MDKDPYKLGKTREKKPEGYLSSEELFDFFEKKKIFIKRKDNLPRFCEQHNIQMIKFKREGSGGTTPTAYRIPSDTKINQIKQKLMLNNNSILGLELIKKKENKILQIFDEAKNQQESKSSIADKVSEVLGVPCNRKLVRRVLNEKRSTKLYKLK
tara:strand:+ start:226 stop:690 length:465 start_codon:yes stop_codon:yes gene_type:complete